MKRFITYLYECERGEKTKNTGFIRVDIRGSVVNMEISVRKLHIQNTKGIVSGVVVFKGLQGIQIGEIQLVDGQGELRLQLPARNLQGKPVSIDDVVGIGIQFEGGCYIASCWKDEYARQIAHCEYQPWIDIPMKEEYPVAELEATYDEELEKQKEAYDELQTEIEAVCDVKIAETESVLIQNDMEPVQANFEQEVRQEIELPQYCYRKLDLTHMHMLPMQDRHYMSNAFLVHGFWNYGYVVLKTENKGDKKTSWLGVPGVYERPEAAMALAFGFPLFEAIPSEVAEAPMNVEQCFSEKEMRARSFFQSEAKGTLKNQPSKERLFGCWFVELHI